MKRLVLLLSFVVEFPFLLIGFLAGAVWMGLYCGYENYGRLFDWYMSFKDSK